ncbi:hypothetical protein [Chitinasiproducens palmae]|uniref:Uncharacterized protein n=1 Tax=Chitinasiproducens palmae TaxID=1770053 RepID=A0A1H2PKR5_9BURK|nr:hypothetical protein [Chitinasiproducens palmae]SDV46555.1 hypothetical protein SAMN05216551_101430 [Chitinasiproducens palmae]
MPILFLLMALVFALQSVSMIQGDLSRNVELRRSAALAESMGGQHTAALRYLTDARPIQCDLDATWRMDSSAFLPQALRQGGFARRIVSLCNKSGVATALLKAAATETGSVNVRERLTTLFGDASLIGKVTDLNGEVTMQTGEVRNEFRTAIAQLGLSLDDPVILTLWD